MALAAQLKTGKAHIGAFQRPDAPIQPLAFGLKLGVGRLQPFDFGLQAAQQIQVSIFPQQLLFSVQLCQPNFIDGLLARAQALSVGCPDVQLPPLLLGCLIHVITSWRCGTVRCPVLICCSSDQYHTNLIP